jgi:hypothetical protein
VSFSASWSLSFFELAFFVWPALRPGLPLAFFVGDAPSFSSSPVATKIEIDYDDH